MRETMNICVGEEYLRLQGSTTENFFYTTLFPWLCAVGVVGNCLNLTVLLSTEVRQRQTSVTQRSNVLLVALAFCDILFLVLMIPHSLANFDYFGLNLAFRSLYLPTKVHLISLANWCSAVAIWLVIAICAERLTGIRSFQHSKTNWSYCTTAHVIICIIAGSALITSYNHFSYHCVVKLLCNDTQIISKCFDVIQETWPGNHTNITPAAIRLYVRWSQVANVVIIIVLPIVIMLALNIALLFVVRQQSFLVYSRLHSASTNSEATLTPTQCANCKRKLSSASQAPPTSRKNSGVNGGSRPPSFVTAACMASAGAQNGAPPAASTTCSRFSPCIVAGGVAAKCGASTLPPATAAMPRKSSAIVAASENGAGPQQIQTNLFRRSIDQTVQFQAEHRVTVTVCAIVTCFTITQGPSAIVLSISFLSGHKPPFVNSNALWYHVNSLTGFLVIIGKTLNFVLFCLSSAAFRRRLVRILRKKLLFLKSRRSSFLGNSSTGGGNGANGCGGTAAAAAAGTAGSAAPPPTYNLNGSLCRKKSSGERKLSLIP